MKSIALFLLVSIALAATVRGSSVASDKNRKLSWDIGDIGGMVGDLWDQLTSSLGFGNDSGSDEYLISGSEYEDTEDNSEEIWDWDEWLSALLDGSGDGLLPQNGSGGFDFGDLGDLDLGDLDLGDLDLGDLDLGGLDFGGLDFDALLGSIGGDDLDVCTLVELGIGMAPSFGIEANCACNGDLATNLEVSCSFDQCAPGGSEVCGQVDLTLAFGSGPVVGVGVCADFANDDYEKTCFSYELDVRGGDGDGEDGVHTCAASYGGNACDCSFSDTFCLAVDCTPFLEGGKMDTCQLLSMANAGDVANWFPAFEAFAPGFELLDQLLPGDNENDLPPVDGTDTTDTSTSDPTRPLVGNENGGIAILQQAEEVMFTSGVGVGGGGPGCGVAGLFVAAAALLVV